MPGVPEIEVPTTQPASTPAPTAPEPGPGVYFGKAVGGVLSEAGEQLHGIGMMAYERAAEATAQEGEANFQKAALKLRDEYRSKYLADATNSHQQYTDALEKAQAQIAKNLPTKHAQTLYNSNSLRNMRLVQESMDSHFETQSKAREVQAYSLGLTEKVNSAARYALEEGGIVRAGSVLKAAHDDALSFATSHGMDADTAEQFASKDVAKVADGMMTALTKAKNPLAKEAFEKYGDLLSTTRHADIGKSITAQEVPTWVSQQMANAVRMDPKGNPDPQGAIRHSAILDAEGKLDPDDPLRQQKVDALELEWRKHINDYNLAGKELEATVFAKGREGGRFTVPRTDPDWQSYSRLYPIQAENLEKLANNRVWQDSQRYKISSKDAGKDAYGATWSYIENLPHADLKQMTPAAVENLIRDNYHGPDAAPPDAEVARAKALVKRMQDDKQSPLERKVTSIATTVLASRFNNNPNEVRKWKNRAIEWLGTAIEGGEKDENKLREGLGAQVKTDSWFFGHMPLEKFTPGKTTKPPASKADLTWDSKTHSWVK